MGAPARVPHQAIETAGEGDQQQGVAQQGLDQAAFSQLNIERRPLPTCSIGWAASR